jgi:hypothetical protein
LSATTAAMVLIILFDECCLYPSAVTSARRAKARAGQQMPDVQVAIRPPRSQLHQRYILQASIPIKRKRTPHSHDTLKLRSAHSSRHAGARHHTLTTCKRIRVTQHCTSTL